MTLLCFKYRMKLSKCYYGRNLNEHAKMWWCPAMDLAWLIMVGTTSSTKVKLMRLLNKHGMACMFIKTSHTLLLRSTNCPPPSSKFTNVKNNQMLMWPIVVSNVIQSSNSNLLKQVLTTIEEACVKTSKNKLHKSQVEWVSKNKSQLKWAPKMKKSIKNDPKKNLNEMIWSSQNVQVT